MKLCMALNLLEEIIITIPVQYVILLSQICLGTSVIRRSNQLKNDMKLNRAYIYTQTRKNQFGIVGDTVAPTIVVMQPVAYLLHGKTGTDDLRLDFISCVVHLKLLSQLIRMKKSDGDSAEPLSDFSVSWGFSLFREKSHILVYAVHRLEQRQMVKFPLLSETFCTKTCMTCFTDCR